MIPIDERLKFYLTKVAKGEGELPSEELLTQFTEDCRQAFMTMYEVRDPSEFRLRMSNIGKDARQLWLQKNYGGDAEPPAPEFMLRMVYGHIIEKLFLTIIKAAGIEVQESNENVTLDIDGLTIKGEYDVKIGGKHWDFKTASDWSYKNKFINVDSLLKEDSFGYGGQAVAYSLADDTPFGGWFVINKSNGEFKIVDGEKLNTPEYRAKYMDKFRYNIGVVNGDTPPPECEGVEDESYYRKKTGNKILGNKCKFCPCKQKCHPNIQYRPSVVSKANPVPYVYYTDLRTLDPKEDNKDE